MYGSFAIVLLAMAASGLSEAWRMFGMLIGNPTLFGLFSPPLIMLHELGHAWAAQAVGLRVVKVEFGTGRPIFEGSLLGLPFRLGRRFSGGATVFGTNDARRWRLRRWIAIAAGPAVHMLAIVIVLIVTAEVGFVDRHVYALGRGLAPMVQMAQGEYYLAEAQEARRKRDFAAALAWNERALQVAPNHLGYLLDLSLTRMERGELDGARVSHLSLLVRSDVGADADVLLKNNLAWIDLLIGSADLRPQADACSKDAHENCWWRSELRGTRGAVLIELDHVAEGTVLLEEALKAGEDDQICAADACFLAFAALKRDDQGGAHARLQQARALAPDHPLIRRIEHFARDRMPVVGG